MRLEATAADNETKVWLTDDELEELRRATVSYRPSKRPIPAPKSTRR